VGSKHCAIAALGILRHLAEDGASEVCIKKDRGGSNGKKVSRDGRSSIQRSQKRKKVGCIYRKKGDKGDMKNGPRFTQWGLWATNIAKERSGDGYLRMAGWGRLKGPFQ